jgi:nucleotide-binding universal stress UspA family protein
MKILCPIDFTPTSQNGLEYAARLAKTLNGSLSMLYVRTSVWPEAIQLKQERNESDEDILTRLELFSRNVNDEFNVHCHYHLESTTLSFEEAVAKKARKFDLIVMGTNGADNYYQYVFGSNSFHVIEKSECPVLMVPEGFEFCSIRFLVYAYDPETNPIFLIDQLKKLAIPVGAGIKVLHISTHKPTAEIERKLESMKEAIVARAPRGIHWSFDSKYSDDVSFTLNQFVEENHADILALSFHHRSLLENLFKENTIKKISAIAHYPVFVFWR